jgi:hypothetical protein
LGALTTSADQADFDSWAFSPPFKRPRPKQRFESAWGHKQLPPIRRILIPGPSHLHSGGIGPNSGSSPLGRTKWFLGPLISIRRPRPKPTGYATRSGSSPLGGTIYTDNTSMRERDAPEGAFCFPVPIFDIHQRLSEPALTAQVPDILLTYSLLLNRKSKGSTKKPSKETTSTGTK